MGRGICGGEIEGFVGEGGPDGAVAVGGHLLEFLEFVRVVGGTERAVAAAVDVDAVGDFVVLVPEPVFFADGGEGFGGVAGGLGFAEEGVG